MKKIIFILLVCVIVVVSIFVWKDRSKMENEEINGNNTEINGDEKEISKNLENYLNTDNWKSYEGNGFSFEYSGSFKITGSVTEEGEIVAAEDDNFGFQIYISPFDESGPITPERIWQDIPDATIDEPKIADLDGAETLVFYGFDEDLGETFEAWVVKNGKLYQIMTTREAEELLIKVLEKWTWK